MTADDRQPRVDDNGTVDFNGISVPFSAFASEEAKRAFTEGFRRFAARRDQAVTPGEVSHEELVQHILTTRKTADDARRIVADQMAAIFPVELTRTEIGGIPVDVVIPRGGPASENANRILINLHGGGMIFGARWEGLVNSIPVASVAGIKVVTVDYRMAPEHRFPAASEDVAAVYTELLKDYRPENIGIYGYSAGSWLTAQAVAWFHANGLPQPGAVGLMGAGAATAMDGDSHYLASVLVGEAARTGPMATSRDLHSRALLLYGSDADPTDPRANPMAAPEVVASFPPTMVLNSTRDGTMSCAIRDHLRLTLAGVTTELYLWDGLGHGFCYDPRLPESLEAYEIIAAFFRRHLGRTPH